MNPLVASATRVSSQTSRISHATRASGRKVLRRERGALREGGGAPVVMPPVCLPGARDAEAG